MIFFTIFTQGWDGGGGSSDTRGCLFCSPCLQSEERNGKSRLMFQLGVDVCDDVDVLNTAIFGGGTSAETLPSCTPPLAGGCSFGLSGTMSGCSGGPTRSLCFALPSHSDNRVSHVLLPV